MAYGDNKVEYEAGAPKKADVLIRSTQHIALKQEELSEQTRQAVSRIDEAIELLKKNNATGRIDEAIELLNKNTAAGRIDEAIELLKKNATAGRIDEAIELFSKSNQDSTAVIRQCEEVFARLQEENAALKQELLYLAKQSENIYAVLSEKISELSERTKVREEVLSGFAEKVDGAAGQSVDSGVFENILDRLADVAEQNKRSGKLYEQLTEKLETIAEQSKNNAKANGEITEKLETLSEQTKNSVKAYGELSDRLSVSDRREPSSEGNTEIMSKLNFISEQLRRSEGAHSMLADKFEILSMRVDQFGFENSKTPYSQVPPAYHTVQPVQAVPVQTVVKEELDYDKLAEKVASLISAREVVSPDYIASRVAEQIVLPGMEAAHVNVNVDSEGIAKQVADLINVNGVKTIGERQINIDEEGLATRLARKINELRPDDVAVATTVDVDEQAIADRLAEKLGGLKTQEAVPAAIDLDEDELVEKLTQRLGSLKNDETAAAVAFDEEALAEKIAEKVGSYRTNVTVPVSSNVNIDEDELADAISLKVGSLKSEDFEILVDDDGCGSISKGIAERLDYERISNIIADKLRDALDLAAVNAPDYEEMAERISEKITVAGINEDAIADKAAAVLSNYLPEFDSDEITDKITGAVIDVVSAMPQPTVDSEAICNTITERLIESQEDHDYDIVIDDDGISKITGLVSEEIENKTVARFESIENQIAKLSEIISAGKTEETSEQLERVENELAKLSDIISAEKDDVNDETSVRFDKVDEDLARICELLTPVEEDEEVVEETLEEQPEEAAEVQDYSELTGLLAEEIQKGTSARFDKVEEEIAKLCELVTNATVTEEEVEEETDLSGEEYAEEYDESYEEDEYAALSEVVAAEIQKGVSTRLDGLEQNIEKLCELVSNAVTEEVVEEETEVSDEDNEEENTEEYGEVYEEQEDYSAFTEIVAAEIEKGVSPVSVRLDSVEENIAKISEILANGVRVEQSHAESEEIEETQTEVQQLPADGYSALSEVVAAEIEKGVSPVSVRLDGLEENIAKLSELLANGAVQESGEDEYEEYEEFEDYSAVSNAVTYEIVNALSGRFETIENNIEKLTQMLSEGVQIETVAEESESDYTKLSETVTESVSSEIQKSVSSRLDGVEESISKVANLIAGGIAVQSVEGGENYSQLSEVMTDRIVREISERLQTVEENIAKITDIVECGVATEVVTAKYEEDYSAISDVVSAEIEKGVSSRLENLEQNVAKISEIVSEAGSNNVAYEPVQGVQPSAEVENALKRVEDEIARITEIIENPKTAASDERIERMQEDIAKITSLVESGAGSDERIERMQEDIAKITAMVENGANDKVAYEGAQIVQPSAELENALKRVEDEIARINERMENSQAQAAPDERIDRMQEDIAKITAMVEGGLIANAAQNEAAAAQAETLAPVEEEEEEALVTVSDLVKPEEQTEESEEFEEDEEEEEDGDDGDSEDDFLIDVLDMDAFSDNELMPGEMSDYAGGVDFANMMKFKRSFIARIIQSPDDYKQYYGEVKHALLSYKKVNSNVAWGAERFNKGRETIARMKIRGKTLCMYLALDPNEYKTSVYHHLDVSDNKSVAGTPMMVKIKSPLGVRKAIRLIDEMLAKRNGEKKEIPERDYAAMYPYETIEELIEDGLVKDVRKK